MELIEEIKAIIDAGLESRRGALAALHPDWSDEEIDLKLEEIDNESSQRMNKMMGAMNNGGFAGNEN